MSDAVTVGLLKRLAEGTLDEPLTEAEVEVLLSDWQAAQVALLRVRPLVQSVADQIITHDSQWRPALDLIDAALGEPRQITSHRFVPCYMGGGCARKQYCHHVDPHHAKACGALLAEHAP